MSRERGSVVRFLAVFGALVALGCEPGPTAGGGAGAGETDEGAVTPDEVVSVSYGPGAGFGGARMPDAVLDAPSEGTAAAPTNDVVSLGNGGELVLSFVEHELVDGPGADVRVVENVFYAAGDPTRPYVEVATVAVSDDGEEWTTFPFDYDPHAADIASQFRGFAGVALGGDEFDLADVGRTTARFVRLRDAGAVGPPDTRTLDGDGEFVDDPGNRCCGGESQGFDVNGVVALHWR